MTDRSLISFADPAAHAEVTEIIRQLSGNPRDIREVALHGIDLRAVREILDLGCGFGFMSRAVLERASPGARLVGIDACGENRAAFLRETAARGKAVEFHAVRLGTELRWPAGSFDLVVASYSLYFFPELIGEIARVLRPAGLFLAITHHQDSMRELCRLAGAEETGGPLMGLLRQFSAENGGAKLRNHFGRVEMIDYPNQLRFEASRRSELLCYVQFKLPWLRPEADPAAGLPRDLERRITEVLDREGEYVMDKSDAVFRCWEPGLR